MRDMRFVFPLLAGLILWMTFRAQAEQKVYDGVRYQLYRIDPAKEKLEIFWRDESGKPFNTFKNLEKHLNKQGKRLRFAMNAGIYEPDWIPSGLHIEDGKQLVELNTNPPPPKEPGKFTPNFYLKPNGVFFIDEEGPSVLATQLYQTSGKKPRLATQSGPLLLHRGRIHPIFEADSTSRLIRNGVGVDDKGRIVLVTTERSSRGQINFHGFASLFLSLDCQNALYLDGDISQVYIRGESEEIPNTSAFAAILAVTEPLPGSGLGFIMMFAALALVYPAYSVLTYDQRERLRE